MIEIRYTGAFTSEEAQTLSSKSIGGYVSTTKIPNDILNNLFNQISELQKQKQSRQTILIALKNISELIEYNVSVRIKYSSNDVKYLYAFATPASDDNGEYFERLNSQQEIPLYATLADVQNNQLLNIGTLSNSSSIGLWLVREINDSFSQPLTCDEIDNLSSIDKQEDLEIEINFVDSQSSISTSSSASTSAST